MAGTGEDWRTTMRRLARSVRPARVLCLGDEAFDVLSETALPLLRMDPEEVLHPPDGLERFDLAVVAGLLERVTRPKGSAVVARLRDIHARRLMVKVALANDPGEGWTRTEMLGLGLREVLRVRAPDQPLGLYQFNVYDYKLTPDWFNARNWAHPHLWKP